MFQRLLCNCELTKGGRTSFSLHCGGEVFCPVIEGELCKRGESSHRPSLFLFFSMSQCLPAQASQPVQQAPFLETEPSRGHSGAGLEEGGGGLFLQIT